MPRFTIAHSYTSRRDGLTFGPWAAGDQVELEEADAAWCERDSPGVFAVPEPEKPARQAAPAPNRQAKGGRNRSG